MAEMPRAGRDPRHGLHRQGGDACQLEYAVQAVIVKQDGVAAVDVPAPEEMHLLAAVNDLPVREIGALLFADHPAAGIPVEGERQVQLAGALQQVRQQPGVTPGGEQQVRVVALQDGAQVDQQGTDGL